MLTKEQIEQTLKNLYHRENWKNMLAELFVGQEAEVKWEKNPQEITLGNKTAAYRAKNLFRLGSIKLADDDFRIFE